MSLRMHENGSPVNTLIHIRYRQHAFPQCVIILYTERQKKLVTSSERRFPKPSPIKINHIWDTEKFWYFLLRTSGKKQRFDGVKHEKCGDNCKISSTAIAQPIPTPIHMRTRREHQKACGNWLVCQTTSVCNNPITCTARILARAFRAYVRMLRCNSDGYFELGTVWAMDPRPCSLARWIRILCIRQHIVWEESRGSTLNRWSSCRKPADDKRVAIVCVEFPARSASSSCDFFKENIYLLRFHRIFLLFDSSKPQCITTG